MAAIENNKARDRKTRTGFLSIVFAFVWVVAVGLNPLADRSSGAFDEYASVGTQQYMFVYIVLLLFSIYALFWSRGKVARLFGWELIACFLWFGVTISVSSRPGTAAVDLIKQFVFLAAASSIVTVARDETELMKSIQLSFAIIILLDVLAVIVVPSLAIHQVSDAVEGNLAGAWRGLHEHKNKFGELCALMACLSLCDYRWRRRFRDIIVFLLCAFFIAKAHSKMALGALFFAFAIAELYYQISRYKITVGASVIVIPILGLLILWLSQYLSTMMVIVFGDSTFSGRTITWSFLSDYSRDHPFMGSGFSSFFIGKDGPLFRSGDPFLMAIGNAHNTYLDMLVTTGWLGLILALLSFLVVPLRLSYRRISSSVNGYKWFMMVIFLAINGATATVYFSPQRATGLALGIGYFSLRRWRGPAWQASRGAATRSGRGLSAGVGPVVAGARQSGMSGLN